MYDLCTGAAASGSISAIPRSRAPPPPRGLKLPLRIAVKLAPPCDRRAQALSPWLGGDGSRDGAQAPRGGLGEDIASDPSRAA